MSLQSLANQHRAQILARERQAALALDATFKATWARILAAFDPAGDVNAQLVTIRSELMGFAQFGSAVVSQGMQQAAHSGQQDARLLLKTALPPGIIHYNYPQIEAQQALQQSLDSGPIVARFNKMPADAVIRAKKVLLLGQSLGWGPRQVASLLKHELRIQLNDALRIARTEAMVSYRASSLQIYRANADVVTGWTWLASANACDICESMNGTHHSLDESMDTHPNCRCTMTPDTKSYEEIIAA
jgi:SPP1 gp7 family putative phage head morphogenesis protein